MGFDDFKRNRDLKKEIQSLKDELLQRYNEYLDYYQTYSNSKDFQTNSLELVNKAGEDFKKYFSEKEFNIEEKNDGTIEAFIEDEIKVLFKPSKDNFLYYIDFNVLKFKNYYQRLIIKDKNEYDCKFSEIIQGEQLIIYNYPDEINKQREFLLTQFPKVEADIDKIKTLMKLTPSFELFVEEENKAFANMKEYLELVDSRV